MSAIILTPPPPPRRPTVKRKLTTPGLTTLDTSTERTPLLDGRTAGSNDDDDDDDEPSPSASTGVKSRTKPLRDTLSTARFITICIGIFSANFTFAFQSTSVPTLMTGISSGFGHAELGSYLGSVFTLANTAGELMTPSTPSTSSDSERCEALSPLPTVISIPRDIIIPSSYSDLPEY